ncbi:hypothetical protein [Anaerovorax odorimutans]|uniref:hypothetical protein n=1 Tax=Anaerovorax odorimutans TaxID=109327 RepID=UPI0004004D84|nr:hypothetical protein [Anaerovorax odorimutans]
MKITLNNIVSSNNGEHIKSKAIEKKETEQKQSYDKITIGNTSVCDLPKNQFVSVLKNHIMTEVKTGASSYKLNDLSNQIALGEYDTNINSVVKRMMLDSGKD